jgi:hypothetical protein
MSGVATFEQKSDGFFINYAAGPIWPAPEGGGHTENVSPLRKTAPNKSNSQTDDLNKLI